MSRAVKVRRAILWLLFGTGSISRIKRMPIRWKIVRPLLLLAVVIIVFIFIRVILWILLTVVSIFVLLVILLAIPMRYNVRASTVSGGEKTALAKMNYFFWLVRAVYVYEEGDSQFKAYIGWYQLGSRKKKVKKAENAVLESVAPSAEQSDEKEPESKAEKMPEPDRKPAGRFKSIKDTYAKIKANINVVLTYPNRKIITELIFGTTKKLFKIVKPKHFDIYGTVGFADPAKTGMFIGLYEAITELFGIRQNVRLHGNFDTPSMAADLQVTAKGSISIARMAFPIIMLIIKKPIRTLIKDLLREEDSNE
ncbi:MAG: hypothetical protein FWC32_09700 [Firmicutes bacterium]|nr:hypothetical protein [Bacillota bacterium]